MVVAGVFVWTAGQIADTHRTYRKESKMFSRGKSRRNKIVLLTMSLVVFLVGNTGVALADEPEPTDGEGWLAELNIYAKVFAAVLTGLGVVFGLPLTVLQFRKTRAEIRKLELEAESLEANAASVGAGERGAEGHQIVVEGADNVSVRILADPRFLGPLLLLLDFIIAWILITLANYALQLVTTGTGLLSARRGIMIALAAVLLVPIAREARRVRKVLEPLEEPHAGESNEAV